MFVLKWANARFETQEAPLGPFLLAVPRCYNQRTSPRHDDTFQLATSDQALY